MKDLLVWANLESAEDGCSIIVTYNPDDDHVNIRVFDNNSTRVFHRYFVPKTIPTNSGDSCVAMAEDDLKYSRAIAQKVVEELKGIAFTSAEPEC